MSRSVCATLAFFAYALHVEAGTQQPSFRASVDLIAVDAQIVDSRGDPVLSFGPADFEVTLNGRRRRVLSADVVEFGDHDGRTVQGEAASARARTREGRIFIVAVDTSSFEVGAARAPMEAAQAFVASLASNDYVGLYTYPNGPQVVPSLDRARVRQGLGRVVGERMAFGGLFNLKPSEVVDITAMTGARPGSLSARAIVAVGPAISPEIDPVGAVQQRECPDDGQCASRIVSEASAMAMHLEAQAARTLGGLSHLLQVVSGLPGRKTVVLITGGVTVSDRPGGRPNVGDLSTAMGQVAARSHATLYTIHIDDTFSGAYAAAGRRVGELEGHRDRSMSADWLDRFSAAAGGTRIAVPVGAGAFAFDRVLRETAAMYLLGVEPEDGDRDGRPRELRVRVTGAGSRDATVRHRQWVAVD
jgi:VWFA-related protein